MSSGLILMDNDFIDRIGLGDIKFALENDLRLIIGLMVIMSRFMMVKSKSVKRASFL